MMGEKEKPQLAVSAESKGESKAIVLRYTNQVAHHFLTFGSCDRNGAWVSGKMRASVTRNFKFLAS